MTPAPPEPAGGADPVAASPEGVDPAAERDQVTALLGRPPQGPYEVVVRTPDGAPVVLRNAPFLDDGTPMPTRYWLLDPAVVKAVSRLESAGGVRRAEAEVDPAAVADAHRRHAAERDAAIDADHPGHVGPRPSGGVGGTRQGVKCLHAHYAWHLAGGDDPVGAWVAARLVDDDPAHDDPADDGPADDPARTTAPDPDPEVLP